MDVDQVADSDKTELRIQQTTGCPNIFVQTHPGQIKELWMVLVSIKDALCEDRLNQLMGIKHIKVDIIKN